MKSHSRNMIENGLDRDVWLEKAMDEYGESIARLAYHYVRDWGRAEDITQDVFISAYKNIASFKGESSEKTWIYRIAVNRCKDVVKSAGFRRTVLSKLDFFHTKSTDATPELTLLQQDTNHALFKCVFELSTKYREVILLFYYNELSLQEIGEVLKLKTDTVKTRLSRARARLKMSLSEEGYDGQ